MSKNYLFQQFLQKAMNENYNTKKTRFLKKIHSINEGLSEDKSYELYEKLNSELEEKLKSLDEQILKQGEEIISNFQKKYRLSDDSLDAIIEIAFEDIRSRDYLTIADYCITRKYEGIF